MSAEPDHLYAALLDVLGYRHHLDRDRNSGKLALQHQLSGALGVFDSVNDAVFNVRAISDTLIVTCLDHEHFPSFLGILRDVFVAFLEQKLFIRGGIAYSRHFQSGRLTYSHAIARAYELETTSAIYPRIVVDKNIVDMYDVGEALPKIRNVGLLCQENGLYFLNVLTKDNWETVYELARQIYESSSDALYGDDRVLAKHRWFERYLLNSPHAPESASGFLARIEAV